MGEFVFLVVTLKNFTKPLHGSNKCQRKGTKKCPTNLNQIRIGGGSVPPLPVTTFIRKTSSSQLKHLGGSAKSLSTPLHSKAASCLVCHLLPFQLQPKTEIFSGRDFSYRFGPRCSFVWVYFSFLFYTNIPALLFSFVSFEKNCILFFFRRFVQTRTFVITLSAALLCAGCDVPYGVVREGSFFVCTNFYFEQAIVFFSILSQFSTICFVYGLAGEETTVGFSSNALIWYAFRMFRDGWFSWFKDLFFSGNRMTAKHFDWINL